MYLSSHQNGKFVRELKRREERRGEMQDAVWLGRDRDTRKVLSKSYTICNSTCNSNATVEWACCELLHEVFSIDTSVSVYKKM